MRRALTILAPLVAAALAIAGCGRSNSEQAALELAAQAAGGGMTSYDLEFRRELDGGFAWRVAPRPAGSSGDVPQPTHLGVMACVSGDQATEAVRFSFLHWEPESCEGGRARLRRVRLTPEQDADRLGTFVAPPRGVEADPALHRVTG
jgi:hypothetical protein